MEGWAPFPVPKEQRTWEEDQNSPCVEAGAYLSATGVADCSVRPQSCSGPVQRLCAGTGLGQGRIGCVFGQPGTDFQHGPVIL